MLGRPPRDKGRFAAPQAAEAAEALLLQLDPVRGIRMICAELERLTPLDPKLRAAMDKLEELHREIVEDDPDNVFIPAMWLFVRSRLLTTYPPSVVCASLRDGDRMLRAVEMAMPAIFSPEARREVISQGSQLAADGSGAAAALDRAREELARLAPDAAIDVIPPLIVRIYLGVGAATTVYGCTTTSTFTSIPELSDREVVSPPFRLGLRRDDARSLR